jgi:hypothetical protein
MIEVVRDENGWWDWLKALEEAGMLQTYSLPSPPILPVNLTNVV